MWPAVIVAEVLAGDSDSVSVVPNNDVVKAISTKSADHSLGKGIGSRRASRDHEPPNAKALDAFLEREAESGSRSWIEKREVGRSQVASTTFCDSHIAVGCSVALIWTTVRRPSESTMNT
jgi:hypothetical protein